MGLLASPLDFTSVFAAFEATALQFPERPFFHVLRETAQVYGIPAGQVLYREMLARVVAKRNAYHAAGYGTGHRVGLLLENRPSYFEHWFALNALGASIVPINPDLRASELAYLVEHSEMVLAVAIDERLQGMVLSITPDNDIPAIARGEQNSPAQRSEAALLYTSGTTGLPKGCVLPNEYFLNCGDWYQNVGGACALHEDGERMLTPLPLFHMNAMACSVMGMIAVGGCLSVLDRFHPSTWWASVRESRASVIHYLGVMPAMLMSAQTEISDTDHKVRFGFGAGVEKQLHAPFEQRFNIPLIEAWAMTETGNGAVIAASHGARHVGSSCFGRPAAAVEIRLLGDDGHDSDNGEMLVRRAGDNPRFGFFDRYLKNPTETQHAWADGWFHTGDIARRNNDGSYVFVDRKKNVIRRSGENIAAVEVEGVLNKHPNISAAAVTATPDPIRGDEVFACIVLNDKTNAEAIVVWCLEQLAYYKAPGYVHFVDHLPLTSTNKVQRGKMKELVTELINDPATVDCRPLKRRSK